MHDYRTAQTAFDAQDPGSDRLSTEQVIAINRAHLEGVGWEQIAVEHGTNRKNVSRIVQGRRHRHLHPQVNPSLYASGEAAAPDPVAVAVTEILREARDRILKELRGS